MLQIMPILVALKRHKAGTILIALQIALTLAIVCNAISIIQQRVVRLSRPTGMIETNLLTVGSDWVGVSNNDIGPLIRSDLLALRQTPGVQSATVSYAFPLYGSGWSASVRTDPSATNPITSTAQYFTDDQAIDTTGAKLIAGRNFRSDEVSSASSKSYSPPPQVIVTKALADRVYPDGSALGKAIYLREGTTVPSTIIGIMESLRGPRMSPSSDVVADNAVLIPIILTDQSNSYLVRAKPGQLTELVKSVPAMLYKVSRTRVIPQETGVRTFDVVREQAYRIDHGMVIIMSVVCVVLLSTTAAGIVGLTSFWVGQRRRQIGVRRALGATRGDIFGYFLTENLLISVSGAIIGAILAVGVNIWLSTSFEMTRLSLGYIGIAMIVVLLLGQGAVLAPAIRASRMSPLEVMRSK
jgi:putative ABC transport system permease protein